MTARSFLGLLSVFAVLLLANAPVLIIIIVSFSSSPIFDLPHGGLSLRWYETLFHTPDVLAPLATSLELALSATAISLVLGSLCAAGLARRHFQGRSLLTSAVLSPMMLPGVVLGIALLPYLHALGFANSFPMLLVAHVVITLPYVVRIMLAALILFDTALMEAASTLGCRPVRAVLTVMMPNIVPPLLCATIFAFLASFDNYALALFLGDVFTVTLPIQIINYLSLSADPTVAALSVLLVLGTLVSLVAAERLAGLRRIMET